MGDECDNDKDGDGVPNDKDNCHFVSNPGCLNLNTYTI